MAVWNWPYWPVVVAPFIGSFLGVLVVRLPSGKRFAFRRSVCDSCGHTLGALDLFPLASWLASKARCRYCGSRISIFFPAIEFGALVVAIWAASLAQGWALWISCWLGWSLIALAAIDWREGLLPDILTLPLIPVGFLAAFLAHERMLPYVFGAIAGFALFATIKSLYARIRAREGLGYGDVKLAAAAGAFVGWEGLPSVVLVAALTGLITALIGGVARRELALDQRIAFGPGLCLGVWLVWLYGPFQ